MKTNRAIGQKLSMGGYLKLAEWFKPQHAALVAAHRSYTNAAKMASKDLKLDIGPSQIKRVSEELNLPLDSNYAKDKGHNKNSQRVTNLEKLVVHLYQKLGEQIPDDLLPELSE